MVYSVFSFRVYEPNSGRSLEVFTTQPGIQLYTANGLDGHLVGKNGITYKKYGAFCLETQNYPDAINHVSTLVSLFTGNFMHKSAIRRLVV